MSIGEILFWFAAVTVPFGLLVYGMYWGAIADACVLKMPDKTEIWPLDCRPLWMSRKTSARIFLAGFVISGGYFLAALFTFGFWRAFGATALIVLGAQIVSFFLVRRWVGNHPKEVHRARATRDAGGDMLPWVDDP